MTQRDLSAVESRRAQVAGATGENFAKNQPPNFWQLKRLLVLL
jgi:hypothetical protein